MGPQRTGRPRTQWGTGLDIRLPLNSAAPRRRQSRTWRASAMPLSTENAGIRGGPSGAFVPLQGRPVCGTRLDASSGDHVKCVDTSVGYGTV
jgi:hypothetical protein